MYTGLHYISDISFLVPYTGFVVIVFAGARNQSRHNPLLYLIYLPTQCTWFSTKKAPLFTWASFSIRACCLKVATGISGEFPLWFPNGTKPKLKIVLATMHNGLLVLRLISFAGVIQTKTRGPWALTTSLHFFQQYWSVFQKHKQHDIVHTYWQFRPQIQSWWSSG